jgi:hypothetical protein
MGAVAALILVVFAATLIPRLGSATPGSASQAARPGPGAPQGPVMPTSAQFSFGFDFSQTGPYYGTGSNAKAVASALRVLSGVPGMLEDTSIMDWGLPDPEPSPGTFNLAPLAARISLITSVGGTPVITLCAAPTWMTDGTGPDVAPTPAHYADFAALAAKIAQTFPQVRYFVVWNELKGFWNPASSGWDISQYTDMYNDVYAAIKRVRPDALVGGPYAVTLPYATPQPGALAATPHGAWGYLNQPVLDAIAYWLAHKAGAQFVAVDGPDFPVNGPITDPLTATEKYAAVDRWLRAHTSLPIWWMESRIQPDDSGWTADQAAAIRVAALVEFASSGARAGLEWQPQQDGELPDEGLWTATQDSGGGQPTVLARLLPAVLAVLRDRVAVVPDQPSGILVARGRAGAIAVNTTARTGTALIDGTSATLGPGQVRVTPAPG